MVPRKTGGKELGIKLGAIALVLVALAVSLSIPMLRMIMPLILLGAGWLGWIIRNRSSVEVSAMLRRFVELVISSDTAEGWTMNDSGQWMYF